MYRGGYFRYQDGYKIEQAMEGEPGSGRATPL